MNLRRRVVAAALAAAMGAGGLSGCAASGASRFRVVRTGDIYSARHDAASGTLTIVARDGTVLDYSPVDPAIVSGFWAAGDKDAYYRETIKGKIPSTSFDSK